MSQPGATTALQPCGGDGGGGGGGGGDGDGTVASDVARPTCRSPRWYSHRFKFVSHLFPIRFPFVSRSCPARFPLVSQLCPAGCFVFPTESRALGKTGAECHLRITCGSATVRFKLGRWN